MIKLTKKNLLIAGITLTSIFAACKKEEVVPTPSADTEVPTIVTSKPLKDGMYMVDSTGILIMPIALKSTITDNDNIHMVTAKIYYIEKDTTVMTMLYHPDAATFNLDTTFTNTVPYPLVMDQQNHKLIITVTDHSGNTKSDTTAFFIHYMG